MKSMRKRIEANCVYYHSCVKSFMLSEHWAPDSRLKIKHKQGSAKNSFCGNHGGKLRLRWEKLSSQGDGKHSRIKEIPSIQHQENETEL